MPESADVALVITLFGPMQVRVNGGTLPTLRSRKALWALALLILRHERPVEREWLAGTLWPDIDSGRAFRNLRVVLSELRAALGSQGERLRTTTRHTLLFETAGATIDLLTFDAAITNGGPATLEEAVALYKGPFLEGCTADWALSERDARERACLNALQKLAEAAAEGGDPTGAAEYWRRAVEIAPLWEAARRGRMAALAAGGDTNAALQVYRAFVEFLKSDPRAVPDAQTTELYSHLRAQVRRRATTPAAEKVALPLDSVRGSLLRPINSLIGREEDCLEVVTRFAQSRLVTLTGPGGIGKTQLAITVAREVAPEYPDGVCLVALESLADGRMVTEQVSRELGVREEPERTPLQGLTAHLSSRRLLLVLDNCEHLLEDSAHMVTHLVHECAGLRVLATSREALGVTGEITWSVPALPVPDLQHLPNEGVTLVGALPGYEGVRLFIERAHAVRSDFVLTEENAPAVAQICWQLGGIPLALELAAARIDTMAVEQIAARLPDYLALLAGSSPLALLPRQQTLRATLDWSHDLLEESERVLLRRLSVFAGGWTLEAAENVCGSDSSPVLDRLMNLVDKSLVTFEVEGDSGRYRILEMVRQYAAEKRESSGESDWVRSRHRGWFLALAEEGQQHALGPQQGIWLQRLEAERDNLRAALAWCEADTQGAQAGLRLTAALAWFWRVRGHIREGLPYLTRALEREGAQSATEARAQALKGAGNLAFHQGENTLARTFLEEGLRLFREQKDRRGIAYSLIDLSTLAGSEADYGRACTLLQESLILFREAGDKNGVAVAIGHLGSFTRLLGDYATARGLLEESLQISRELGDRKGIALTLNGLGNIARLQCDYAEAWAFLNESLQIRRDLEDRSGVAATLGSLGAIANARNDCTAAQEMMEESLQIRRELGNPRWVAWSLSNLAAVMNAQGEDLRAQALLEESLSLFREIGDRGGTAWSLTNLGRIVMVLGDHIRAGALMEEGLRLFRESRDTEGLTASLRSLADLQVERGAMQDGVRLGGSAAALRESIGAQMFPAEQKEYDERLAKARAALDEATFAAAWEAGYALTWEQAVAVALGEVTL